MGAPPTGPLARLTLAVPFSDDHLRREVERIPPEAYLRTPYYGKWLIALEALLKERGLMPGGNPTVPAKVGAPIKAEAVTGAIHGGFPTRRDDAEAKPRFAVRA